MYKCYFDWPINPNGLFGGHANKKHLIHYTTAQTMVAQVEQLF
jgi:hypothetical protein